jgi:serine/threonine protein kinase
MDFCPGGDLFRVIRDHGSLEPNVAAFYGAEVVLCFEYLHERDIAFRDLKPENGRYTKKKISAFPLSLLGNFKQSKIIADTF